MPKNQGSEADFLNDVRKSRKSDSTMIMRHAPVGPSKSLDEILADHNQNTIVDNVETSSDSNQHFSKDNTLESKVLPVDCVYSSPYQVITSTDQEYIDNLTDSIVTSGIISPIVVRTRPDGKYEIVAGHHRFQIWKHLGNTSILAIVKVMSDAEAAKALASDNFIHRDMKDYDAFKYIIMLKANGFCRTGRDIAAVLGVSTAKISQLMAFAKFPKGAQDILESKPGLIGADAAYRFQDLAQNHANLFDEAVKLVFDGKLLQTKIDHWINSKLNSTIPSNKVKGSHKEFNLVTERLPKPVKVICTDKEAKIRIEGLNTAALVELIKENLDKLIIENNPIE